MMISKLLFQRLLGQARAPHKPGPGTRAERAWAWSWLGQNIF
jgi:hypothetical protein